MACASLVLSVLAAPLAILSLPAKSTRCSLPVLVASGQATSFHLVIVHGSAGAVQLCHRMEQGESQKKLQMGLMPVEIRTQAACCSLRVYRDVFSLDPGHEVK